MYTNEQIEDRLRDAWLNDRVLAYRILIQPCNKISRRSLHNIIAAEDADLIPPIGAKKQDWEDFMFSYFPSLKKELDDQIAKDIKHKEVSKQELKKQSLKDLASKQKLYYVFRQPDAENPHHITGTCLFVIGCLVEYGCFVKDYGMGLMEIHSPYGATYPKTRDKHINAAIKYWQLEGKLEVISAKGK